MSLTQDLDATFLLLGQDIGNILSMVSAGNTSLANLTTTDKTSLVAALNELAAEVNALGGSSVIDDASTSTAATWSSTEIANRINTAAAAIIGGAPAALDTLQELSAALNDNPGVITAILNAQALRVSVGSVQSFTPTQQLQACQNIGVGDPTTDFVATYTAAKGL